MSIEKRIATKKARRSLKPAFLLIISSLLFQSRDNRLEIFYKLSGPQSVWQISFLIMNRGYKRNKINVKSSKNDKERLTNGE